MPGYLLDEDTTIQCPHGGSVTQKPQKTKLTLAKKKVYVLDDFSAPSPVISGCNFMISGVPSPCMTIRWLMPASKVGVDGSQVLLSSSIGLCLSAAQVPQGSARVSGFQTKAEGK